MCLDKPTLQVTAVYSVSGIRHSWLSCFWKKKQTLNFSGFWFLICSLICRAFTESWPLKHCTGGWRHCHTIALMSSRRSQCSSWVLHTKHGKHAAWRTRGGKCNGDYLRPETVWKGIRNRTCQVHHHSCFLEQSSTYRRPKLPSKTWLESRLHGIAKVKNTWLTEKVVVWPAL